MFCFLVLYSIPLHLSPLRFHCVGGCSDWTTYTVATTALAVRRAQESIPSLAESIRPEPVFVDLSRRPVPEIIDPVFTKPSPKRSFCMTENERFGLVFTKTGSINSGTGIDSQAGGLVRQSYFSYRPARLHRLAKSIPRNRFLGSINVYKYGLRAPFPWCGLLQFALLAVQPRVSTEVTFWHSAEYGSDFRLNSGEIPRNSAEFRGISPELSRNHFRSQKIPRNSVSAVFRGHPSPASSACFHASHTGSQTKFSRLLPSLTCSLHYFYYSTYMILSLRLLYSIHSPSQRRSKIPTWPSVSPVYKLY